MYDTWFVKNFKSWMKCLVQWNKIPAESVAASFYGGMNIV